MRGPGTAGGFEQRALRPPETTGGRSAGSIPLQLGDGVFGAKLTDP